MRLIAFLNHLKLHWHIDLLKRGGMSFDFLPWDLSLNMVEEIGNRLERFYTILEVIL